MRHIDTPGYRHEALFYRGDEEFLAGTVPLVRDAIDADAAVLVAVPRAGVRVLQEALGRDRERVVFADMEEIGRNPGRIIGAWRDFMRAHGDDEAPPLGIGQPIWPERTEAELVECHRHETLLNLAFPHEKPWTLLCPYDAERLPDDVLRAARRNHPHVVERGELRRSETYVRAIPGPAPLPPPAVEPTELRFAHGELAVVREFLARRAANEGFVVRPAGRPRARRRRAGHEHAALRPRRGRAADLARERHDARRGRRRRAHRGSRWPGATARPRPSSAGAGCTWSTSSATWCSCAPRPRAA